ncbi:MAG: hypothetical protein ACXIUZ_10710 [Lysobacteraceae bacterium]
MEATVGPFGRALCALVLWCYAMPAAAVAGDIAGLQSVFSGEVEAWQAGASDAMDRGGLWSHRAGLSEPWHRYRDPSLSALFEARSAWLVRPGMEAMAFDEMRAWNNRHPAFGLSIIDHLDDWPEIDASPVSPLFLRVEDGVVTGFHVGWAASGSPAEQLEWLRNPHRVVR